MAKRNRKRTRKTKQNPSHTPRIYVVDLGSYVQGQPKGAWFDVDSDADDLAWEIGDKLGHPDEIAIHDYEGFGGASIDEYASLEDVARLGELIAEHGEGPLGAFAARVGTNNVTPEGFEAAYRGEYDSEEQYCEQYLEDSGLIDTLPEWARPYFDLERYTRDQFTGDLWSADGHGTVYVFASRG